MHAIKSTHSRKKFFLKKVAPSAQKKALIILWNSLYNFQYRFHCLLILPLCQFCVYSEQAGFPTNGFICHSNTAQWYKQRWRKESELAFGATTTPSQPAIRRPTRPVSQWTEYFFRCISFLTAGIYSHFFFVSLRFHASAHAEANSWSMGSDLHKSRHWLHIVCSECRDFYADHFPYGAHSWPNLVISHIKILFHDSKMIPELDSLTFALVSIVNPLH